MSDTSELRRLFEIVAELPAEERSAAIEVLDVDETLRSRLLSMLVIDTEIERTGDADPPPRTHPWPGDSVGAYRLVAPIGDGGMGSVWLAVARGAPEVDVAIKFAIPVTVTEAEARSRLAQERRVLAALDHPGIVPIVDAGATASGIPFLILRAIHGRTLDVYVRECALVPTDVVKVFEQIAEALEHAHAHGIVHRDVKPQNVLVTENGTPVLIDFGAARITADSELTPSHLTLGSSPRTPAFASPEQKRGEDATARTDVYALGVTLRTLLEARDGAAKIDRRLTAILDRACHRKTLRRYSGAGEFLDALRSWRRDRELRSVRRRSRFRTALLTIVILFTLGQMGEGGKATSRTDTKSAALRSSILNGLAEMPAAEIPSTYEVLGELAGRQDSVDWAIAALVLAVQANEHELARGAIGDVLDRADDASPRRWLEFVHLCSDLGLPGPTLVALRQVNMELLDPAEQFELRVMEATNMTRSGQTPTRDQMQVLSQTLEALDEDPPALEDAGAGPELYRLGLALGDEAAMAHWLGGVSDASWDDPLEASTPEIEALLTLHLWLRESGHVDAISDASLAAVEAELELREQQESSDAIARPWTMARTARVRGALDGDPRRARDLAEAGLVRITESGAAPFDLVVNMKGLGAVATQRKGGAEQARGAFRESAESARAAFGSPSPITEALTRFARDPSRAEPIPFRGAATDVSRLRVMIETEVRLRHTRPWWAP